MKSLLRWLPLAGILALGTAAHALPTTVVQSMTVEKHISVSGGPGLGALSPGFSYQLANPADGLLSGVLFEIRLSGDATSQDYNPWTSGTYVMPSPENVDMTTLVTWLPAMYGAGSVNFDVPVLRTTSGSTVMLQPGEHRSFHDQFEPVSFLCVMPTASFIGTGSSGFLLNYQITAPQWGSVTADVTMTTSLTYIYGAPDQASTAWLLLGAMAMLWVLPRRRVRGRAAAA